MFLSLEVLLDELNNMGEETDSDPLGSTVEEKTSKKRVSWDESLQARGKGRQGRLRNLKGSNVGW